MLGLLYFALMGGLCAANKIGDERARIQHRNEAWAQGKHEYVSRYGKSYWDDTHVFRGTDYKTQHDVVKDAKTGRIIHDYTQEREDKERAENKEAKAKAKADAIAQGNWVYYYRPIHRIKNEKNGKISPLDVDIVGGVYEVATDRKISVGKRKRNGKYVKSYWKFGSITENPYLVQYKFWNPDYIGEIEITKEEVDKANEIVGVSYDFDFEYDRH